MGDYSFAEKIKFVPTLRSRTSPAEYYDWEDAMEDFLHGRGLESHMKMHFVKRTFSKHVLQWWLELQQGHIVRGEEHCRTWKGMKMVLRDRYDPPIEKIVHAYEKKTAAYDTHSLDCLVRLHLGVCLLLEKSASLRLNSIVLSPLLRMKIVCCIARRTGLLLLYNIHLLNNKARNLRLLVLIIFLVTKRIRKLLLLLWMPK